MDEAPADKGGVPTRLQWIVIVFVVIPLVVTIVFVKARGTSAAGEPGLLTEAAVTWRSADGQLPELTDITATAGFGEWRTDESEISGGAMITDVDGDALVDVVVGGGSGGVFFGVGDGRWDYVEIVASDGKVTSVAVDDVDGDGRSDLLFGSAADSDVVVWGGAWLDERRPANAERTELVSGRPTTGMMVADLDDDGVPDVVRLGYGTDAAATADVIWVQGQPRKFEPTSLPGSERRSLAAELADVNGDGRVELWVTRDVGWLDGADSVYERDPESGEWTDRAPALGVDMEIDGMGVTVADLTGDGRLDAYLSDLGDNELLEQGPTGEFRPRTDLGLGRIRPPGADADLVSSSWATAATDVNLDGRVDVVVANGGFGPETLVTNKIADTTVATHDPPGIYLSRRDAVFADVWSDLGLPWSGRSRGMSAGDIDGDGDTDLVFVTHGEGLRVLRNDSEGPSIRVRPESGCVAAGVSVSVTSELGTVRALLAPHTFLGAHAQEMLVGASGPTSVRVEYPAGQSFVQDLVVSDRTTLMVPCRP